MSVEYTPEASRDLEEIAERIANDNPARTRSFRQELLSKCSDSAGNPKLYRVRKEIGSGVRIAQHGDYLIFFPEIDNGVRIQRVLHGARDYAGLF